MIRNIQLSHSGKYLCTVQTTLESLSAVADIIVRGEHEWSKGNHVVYSQYKCGYVTNFWGTKSWYGVR